MTCLPFIVNEFRRFAATVYRPRKSVAGWLNKTLVSWCGFYVSLLQELGAVDSNVAGVW